MYLQVICGPGQGAKGKREKQSPRLAPAVPGIGTSSDGFLRCSEVWVLCGCGHRFMGREVLDLILFGQSILANTKLELWRNPLRK